MTVVDELKDIYEILGDKKEVNRFISENDYLISVLKEAPTHIYNIFGKDIKLCLELYIDPEEDYEELFIVVKSSYSAENALKLEMKFFETKFWSTLNNEIITKLGFAEEPLE